MIGEPRPLCIAVAGADTEALRWAAALRHAGAWAQPLDLTSALADEDVSAVALSSPDVPSIKRALAAGRHVLVCDSAPPSPEALHALDLLARRRSRVLTFAAGIAPFAAFPFVERMLAGPQPMWRARYVRSLRCTPDASSIDDLAVAELALLLSVVRGEPRAVSAAAPSEDARIAVITVHFEGGALAMVEVNVEYGQPRHEVSIICDGRTLVLDAYNTLAPLRVSGESLPADDRRVAPASGGPPAVQAHELGRAFGEYADSRTVVTDAFVRAVRARDAAAGNARLVADAAELWQGARRSIAAGGELVQMQPQQPSQRPALRLIVGGGRSGGAHPAPELTLVPASNGEPEHELQPIA